MNTPLKKYVDLHIHSIFSDGTSTVPEIFSVAAAQGLSALAITDHDCIDAVPAARTLGAAAGIEIIPGIEFSSSIDGKEVHILAYFVDIANARFLHFLSIIKKSRYRRAEKMVENLNAQGVDLRFETVRNIAGEGTIGRPHLAAAMLKEEIIYSFKEAFDRYIGFDCPAYVDKMKVPVDEIFNLIQEAGGLPVLAHPGVSRVDEHIPRFIEQGLAGIEVFHPEHSASTVRYYKRLCRKYGLAFTGGSDFHTAQHSKSQIGFPAVPYAALESLNKKREPVSRS